MGRRRRPPGGSAFPAAGLRAAGPGAATPGRRRQRVGPLEEGLQGGQGSCSGPWRPSAGPGAHFGYANVTGRTDEAFAHLRRVTGMSQPQVWAHVRDAEQVWITRSSRMWELDLGILTGAGIAVRRPEAADDRSAAAERDLHRERAAPPR